MVWIEAEKNTMKQNWMHGKPKAHIVHNFKVVKTMSKQKKPHSKERKTKLTPRGSLRKKDKEQEDECVYFIIS